MGQPLSRVGDKNQVGGAIMRGARTVVCNGIPVGLHVSTITPHAPWGIPHPPHDAATTTSASPDVICEGSPVLRVTSGNSCGHSIVQGSENVIVS
jgi:uncharacterized Zn-binding protein involved in type VI secretion